MPPKVKIQKDDIVRAAVDIVRARGADALSAKSAAQALNCSTQPIYSNFATMEALRFAVIDEANTLCGKYVREEMEAGEYPPYKAAGMAYIRFAGEEKELFKLLFMRNRTSETMQQSFALTDWMESIVHGNTGLSKEETSLFHLEMWAYVHGIAAMSATGFLDLGKELISRMLTDSYQGLLARFRKE